MSGARACTCHWSCHSSTRFENNNSTPRRAKEKTMSTTEETKPPNATDVPTFPFEADANAKVAVLRAMAADFILAEPRSLTPAERRLVSTTPADFVLKAANFGNAVPAVNEPTKSSVALLREGEAYATAYERFIAELESLRELARKS